MSVFHNVYLSKYEEISKQEKYSQFGISVRTLLLYTATVQSSFKWKNVPNQPYFMPERYLLYSARIGFFMRDDKPQLYPIYPAGALMPDGEYDAYTAIYPDGTSIRLKREDVVIIFGNSLKLPIYSIILDFANKSSFALCAVDTALKRALLPPMFTAENEEQLKKILEIQDPEKLLKTILALPTEDNYDDKKMQRLPVFDNKETDVLALWDVFSRYDRMFYRTFGISTVGIQKNERLTEAESTGEEEMTRYTLFQDMYNCRTAGIEEIKNKFGYELSFEVMRDQKTVYELSQSNEDKIELRKIEATKGANIQTVEGGEKDDDSSSVE